MRRYPIRPLSTPTLVNRRTPDRFISRVIKNQTRSRARNALEKYRVNAILLRVATASPASKVGYTALTTLVKIVSKMAQALVNSVALPRGTDDSGAAAKELSKRSAPLLMSTTYSINQSGTKKISVGLQPRPSGQFEAVVKLSGNHSFRVVVLEQSEWIALQSQVNVISDYFATSQSAPYTAPSPIHIGSCVVTFTTSYGMKSIVFELRNQLQRPTDEPADANHKRGSEASAHKNRTRNYSGGAIVMQQPSFEGLIDVIVCVDERFRRLQRYAVDVAKCFAAVTTAMYMEMPRDGSVANITEIMGKKYIATNIKSFRAIALGSNLSAVFVEHFFDIAFAELTVMCVRSMLNEMVDIEKRSISYGVNGQK